MMKVIDFGLKDYKEILNLQESLFFKLTEAKKNGEEIDEYILTGEHYPVITLGRRAKKTNILCSEESLHRNGVDLYKVGRGGDVTYHCPGQMIVYPLLDLEKHRLGVKGFVELMEEAVIRLLNRYDIKGERIEGATGVWIGKGSERERKICAMGIKCSRYCTMHGLALNVNADLSGFSLINPCGFQDKGVTSMELEILCGNNNLNMYEVKKEFLDIFFGLIFPFKEILDLTE